MVDHSGHSMDSEGDVAGKQAGEVPGTSAQPSEAERRITLVALDDLRFDPQEIEVDAGEVVTFVVQNKGKAEHEFVLGDADYQEQHEGDMQGGHEMSRVRNAVTAGPGETAERTWRFDESGALLFGCHEPGHYDGAWSARSPSPNRLCRPRMPRPATRRGRDRGGDELMRVIEVSV